MGFLCVIDLGGSLWKHDYLLVTGQACGAKAWSTAAT